MSAGTFEGGLELDAPLAPGRMVASISAGMRLLSGGVGSESLDIADRINHKQMRD